jgi:hypothetical protein
LEAFLQDQRALIELQRHNSAVDRLPARPGSLPQDARLAELAQALAVIDQVAAERGGSLAVVQRAQVRLEDEIDLVTGKARSEEDRAASGRVTSPNELSAIYEEVTALRWRPASARRRRLASHHPTHPHYHPCTATSRRQNEHAKKPRSSATVARRSGRHSPVGSP